MKFVLILLVVGMVFAGVAMTGQSANAQQYPQVSNLTPFSPEANYMSLPGYLRWQVFVERGTWISHEEAVVAVRDQGAAVAMAPTSPSMGSPAQPESIPSDSEAY